VHAEAPKIEMVHVRVDICLTETLALIVVADMVILSGASTSASGANESAERIALRRKGAGRKQYTFEVDNSTGAGDEESSKFCRRWEERPR